ncbi:MAG TPA: DUF4139 domain-containing protein [Phycisphaerae bacterium]|nr:DUF4139 domain-containing protein [Phycisphaerae bacterium]
MLLLALAAIMFSPSPLRADDSGEGPSVTIYSSADPAGFDPQQFISQQRAGNNPNYAWQVPGFGVVKEVRKVDLAAGHNDLPFTDVAQFIDPTTVSFADLTDADGTSVLEQNFEFDLVSPEKLLEKYLDKEISIVVHAGDKTEKVSGTLLSAVQGSLVIKTNAGLRIVNGMGQSVMLGELPEGLRTRPTLLWKIHADTAGEHAIRTTYQTAGLTWRADYNVVMNEADTKADIGAWVSLLNLSGAGYKNARLKLIAGDVQRIQPAHPMRAYAGRGGEMEMMAKDEAGFQEKSFFEYHLYTLPRRTDILMNTTQQITLFPTARDVTVEKVLVYYGLPESQYWHFADPASDRNLGTATNKKLDVYVRFKNEEANNLGKPLPKGKVRVYKEDDADGTLEFIGEDLIDHTPKNEKVLVKLGQAFDVVGERVQTDFTMDTGRKTMTESIRIQLRNHKNKEQKVIVKENLYRWTTWEITQKSDEFEKIDARTVHFDVMVPPDGEKTITYTVRYTW